jgi:hypothetical protein
MWLWSASDEYQRVRGYVRRAVGVDIGVGPLIGAADVAERPALRQECWSERVLRRGMGAFEGGADMETALRGSDADRRAG